MGHTNQSFTELERFEYAVGRVVDSGTDLTSDYHDWAVTGYICASFGEQGRASFHRLSSLYPGYSREECDRQFDNCLKSYNGEVTVATFYKQCKDRGIDVSLPRGRRPQSSQPDKAPKEPAMTKTFRLLRQWAQWRYNTWRNRVELSADGTTWEPMTDRHLSTFFCRLQLEGVKTTVVNLRQTLNSADFAEDFDPFRNYLDNLTPWRQSDPDYISEFFVGHMVFNDQHNCPYYDRMFRKWFVAMVALWLGRIDENPLMPVFCGQQHIGKTYMARHILPPALANYLMSVSPATRVDKDFEISLSETPLMFLDEFNITNQQRSDAFKYAITSSTSYQRDSYASFREMRKRKASLIGATNHERFIPETEGSRRYLAVDLRRTVKTYVEPLPYEGAYAQALWLLDHGFDCKPDEQESDMITEHNRPFMLPADVEEALRTFVRVPSETDRPEAYSAGDLMGELAMRGFRGNGYSAVNIGRAMKSMGFATRMCTGTQKYIVVLADGERRKLERQMQAYNDDTAPF